MKSACIKFILISVLLSACHTVKQVNVKEKSVENQTEVRDTLLVSNAEEKSEIEESEADVQTLDTIICDSLSNTLPWPLRTERCLEQLMENYSALEHTQVAYSVYDLTADSLIFAHQAEQTFRPASTQKMITAVTALSELGTQFSFKTSIYTTGEIKDSVLQGDIYIVGGFDPAFNSDNLQSLLQPLCEVKKIEGRIYADVSLKDTLKWGEGWCWDDDNYTLTPLLLGKKDCFMPSFMSWLVEHNISSDSVWKKKRMNVAGKLLNSYEHTIDQILLRMMKNSDNLYAEALFYQLAAKDGVAYAGAKYAIKKIEHLIRQLGYNPNHCRVADGSGLSLYNYTSPAIEVAFLRYAYQKENIYRHLYPSLPIAGKDGTLRKRMKTGTAYQNIRAKTGTVFGVSTLAGYATAQNGHQLAFSIMNQGVMTTKTGHKFQDLFCQIITQ